MSQSKPPCNIGRNIGVRMMIEKAVDVLELVSDDLELWLIKDLAPELRDAYPPTDETFVTLALGIVTRNCRMQLKPDRLIVPIEDGTKVEIPYDAIYCIATSGTFAQDLSWFRYKDEYCDVAYINLVEGFHGIPKTAK